MNLPKTDLTNEKIDEIFQDFYSYNEDEEHISMPVGRAKQKLLTLIHQAEITARINENNMWNNSPQYGSTKSLNDRIQALEKEIV